MAKFICEECRCRFDAKRGNICPYCGKNKIKKEPNASELIEEVCDMLKD